MKLRQACCNPRLLDPHSQIVSSKLKVFSEIVEELIDSRHKALVFSQFIGHLQIIREFLDGQGISPTSIWTAAPVPNCEKSGSRPSRPARAISF